MPKDVNDTDMSELEKEIELEMEEPEEKEREEPVEEKELEEEFEKLAEFEREEPEEEFEEVEEKFPGYADRFYELSQREFESEAEVDSAVNTLLNEMERDFFWKKFKKAGKGLLKKGLKLAEGLPTFQAIKGITSLARGDLKGLLGSLVKTGLGTVIPGGGVAMKALGFEASEDPEANREAWENYVDFSREAFENLAGNLEVNADDPLVASRIANEAFRTAFRKVQAKAPSTVSQRKRYRVIRVRPGERVVIKGVKE